MARTLPGTVYLPATGDRPAEPAPYLLRQEDVVRLLQLEAVEDPYSALRRYREKGLRATQVGKNVRFLLPEVLDFLDKLTDENPR